MGVQDSRGRRFGVVAGLLLALAVLLQPAVAQAAPHDPPGHAQAQRHHATRHHDRHVTRHATRHTVAHRTSAARPVHAARPARATAHDVVGHHGSQRRAAHFATDEVKPKPHGIPIGVTVGKLHLKITLPVTLPRLGHGAKPTPSPVSTPTPTASHPTPAGGSSSAPAPESSSDATELADTVPGSQAATGSSRHRTHGHAQATAQGSTAHARTHSTHVGTPTQSRIVALFPLAAPFQSPTALLVALVVFCALGVGAIVGVGSLRRRRT